MTPYASQPERSFWRTAVADKGPFELSDIWRPEINLNEKTKIITYGSCFAQHISKKLISREFSWLNLEKAPHGMKPRSEIDFNYGVFSSRTGNIYTSTMLEQWVNWALGEVDVPKEQWCDDGRYFDPFRPRIEPAGFDDPTQLIQSRQVTINAFRRGLVEAGCLVFTLGLVERWINKNEGYEYSVCPGAVAGKFDAGRHVLEVMDYELVRNSLFKSIERIRSVNKNIDIVITVSPVPLAASAGEDHVLTANMYSKSILRSVAGELAKKFDNIEYFPSYEIITSAISRGVYFKKDMRNVNAAGVEAAMYHFFSAFGAASNNRMISAKIRGSHENEGDDVICEEEILDAFGG